MDIAALIFVPLFAWHAYRAVNAVRTGMFKALGSTVGRVSQSSIFWFCVAREVLLTALFAALLLSVLLRLSGATSIWLFCGYVVVYGTILTGTLYPRLPSNNRLQRTPLRAAAERER